MIRVAVDALGGDRAPGEIVEGSAAAASDGIRPTLFGPPGLETRGLPLVETSESTSMDDSAVESVKAKTDSSLVRAVRGVADGDADVVVSALPLIPATTHLFDARMFARMKKNAFFINVGRGGSVVTDDLVAALNAGTIAGAGLDVTDPEPLPRDHPLWKARNIIITPHMSAQSDLGQSARALIFREQLRRFVAGDKLLAVVDFSKGY